METVKINLDTTARHLYTGFVPEEKQPETTTYKINRSDLPQSAMCECQHMLAAHTGNGGFCIACVSKPCPKFKWVGEVQ